MRRTSKLLKQFSQKQSTALFTNAHKIQAVPIMTVSKNHYSVAMPVKKATKQAQFVVQKKSYATKNIVVPPLADSITEGNIQAWLKNAGDQVAEDDVVCQLETAKVGVDVRAPASGTIKQLFAKTGDKVIVGQNLFELEEGAAPVKKEEKPVAAATQQAAPAAAPVAAPKKEEKKPAPAPVAPPQPAVNTGARTERRVQMSQMRQTIAQRLKDSQNTYALLTTFNEIDMSRLMDMRNRLKDSFQEKHKIKMGFMSAFVKAASVALQEQPVVNAVIDGTDIVYRDYVDVSVAVASPTGLVVPVLRNVESMSFADIEKSIAYYSEKAKTRTMTMQDMQGGTFTISNGGVFGSLMGTPIVNPPQSAILGMHATNKRAVVVNDQIVIRPMMYVALTYDHRIIDGKEAVTFLRRIKALVEDPEQFLTA